MFISSFIDTLVKAYGQRPPARGLCTRALLSETPSPLRFGIAHPGRPKLRHDIPVVPALPTNA
ncbi:hypothetical protein CJD50_05750 [Hafnia paralvei]|uniref:Uncharacterized protein n=1 Tax=Hafnia paralvei TaxID=546367 RepID=A0A2A2MEI6_9GAMM|nr:hypothetical protein CJD50_05750 [Hafnia paralvei]TBM00981.1 hypothetical protein EYY87_21050 [Hafnia paralvei]